MSFLNIYSAQLNWKLVKDNEHIKAYVCKLPDSPLKVVKVETTLDASLSQLISIIRDADHHSDWVFLNDKSFILEDSDDRHWKYYGSNDLPWPITDRDFITQAHLEQDSRGEVKIESVSLPDFIPEKEDCVRIRDLHSCWTLTPLQNGYVHITFELQIDIGGKIPAWLINMAIARGPYNSMKALRNIVDEERFADANLSYINDTAWIKSQGPYSTGF